MRQGEADEDADSDDDARDDSRLVTQSEAKDDVSGSTSLARVSHILQMTSHWLSSNHSAMMRNSNNTKPIAFMTIVALLSCQL